jgi:hypothetical protein
MTENNTCLSDKEKDLNNVVGKIIIKFIDSDIKDVNRFCSINKIKRQTFDKCVEYVKEYMHDLYEKYTVKLCNIKKETYDNAIIEVNKILSLMKNNESFDLLDYFINTKLSPCIFVAITNVICKPREVNISFGNILFSQNLIDENLMINAKLILIDFFVKGENYEVPPIAKEKVIDFLKNHQIPLYPQVYSLALKRYLKHDPVLYNEIGPIESSRVK